MATKTLKYDVQNKQAVTRSLGLKTCKKSGLEEALEDVANGKLTTIHTPKNRNIK